MERNIETRVEEIIRPYIAQPSMHVMGHFNTTDTNTYNTLKLADVSFEDVMYTIVSTHRELKEDTELFDAVAERVAKEMRPSVYEAEKVLTK